jgi:hypothetical protein
MWKVMKEKKGFKKKAWKRKRVYERSNNKRGKFEKKNVFNKGCKKKKRSMKGLNTKGGGGGEGKKKGLWKIDDHH